MPVYLITNLVNKKVYVGKTERSLESRWKEHVRSSKRKTNQPIRRAIKKYGDNSFSIQILNDTTDPMFLRWLERFWIAVFNSRDPYVGYNLTEGGEGVSGYKHSPEALAKVSAALKGRTYSPETRALWSAQRKGNKSRTGQKRTEEEKLKSSIALKKRYADFREGRGKPPGSLGTKHSADWKAAMSERMRGNKYASRSWTEEEKRKQSERVKKSWEKRRCR